MKKVIIVDDEALARSVIADYIKDYTDIEIAAECSNGYEAVKAISDIDPDLIFLDIQMPKLNGFEVLELIDENPPVIFTTAFDEYALKAFDVAAIDYLLKPISKKRFDTAIEKWKAGNFKRSAEAQALITQKEYDSRIVVRDGHTISIIPLDDVLFLEAYDDYVKIHTSEKKFVKKKTLQSYQLALNPSSFFRIHRSYIINISKLNRIENYEKNSYRAILTSGDRLPISRSSYPELIRVLGL